MVEVKKESRTFVQDICFLVYTFRGILQKAQNIFSETLPNELTFWLEISLYTLFSQILAHLKRRVFAFL